MEGLLTNLIRQPPSPLEALPTDILLSVLSSIDSLASLYAFVSASPILYECFSEYRHSILFQRLHRSLGPVIRDAVALSQTSTLDSRAHNYLAQLDEAIEQHRRFIHKSGPLVGLPLETIISTTKSIQAIHYFVDLYASMKLSFLGYDEPLSITERQRVTQAFVRCQTVYKLLGDPKRTRIHLVLAAGKIATLFNPWEIEQVAQIDHFTKLLPFAFPWPGLAAKAPGISGDEYIAGYRCNLPKLKREMCAAVIRDETFTRRLKEYSGLRTQGIHDSLFKYLNPMHWPWLETGTILPDTFSENPLPPDDDPRVQHPMDYVDDSPENPPYAWLDAQGGGSSNRLGYSLYAFPPSTFDHYRWNTQTLSCELQLWRWLGWVFWDKETVEYLKEVTPSEYQTGWLTRHWD